MVRTPADAIHKESNSENDSMCPVFVVFMLTKD